MGSTPALTPDAHLCRTTGAGMHSLLSYGTGGMDDARSGLLDRPTPTFTKIFVFGEGGNR